MTRLRTLVAAAAITLAASACSAAQPEAAGGPQPNPTATVAVENNNWSDMVLYAVQGGIRHRLGTITSMTQQKFRIPRGMLAGSGEIRLALDPVGSRETYTTAPVLVRPGEQVEFTIENHLAISSVSVWSR